MLQILFVSLSKTRATTNIHDWYHVSGRDLGQNIRDLIFYFRGPMSGLGVLICKDSPAHAYGIEPYAPLGIHEIDCWHYEKDQLVQSPWWPAIWYTEGHDLVPIWILPRLRFAQRFFLFSYPFPFTYSLFRRWPFLFFSDDRKSFLQTANSLSFSWPC